MIRYEIDIQAELAIIESKLEWPARELLRSYYLKLLQNPGSVVILALEAPRGEKGPQWKSAWLGAKERDVMRKAIVKINQKREKLRQPLTSEPPNAAEKG